MGILGETFWEIPVVGLTVVLWLTDVPVSALFRGGCREQRFVVGLYRSPFLAPKSVKPFVWIIKKTHAMKVHR